MQVSYCMRSMAFLKFLLKPVVDRFVKISVSGIENIPRRGSFVLVSNHRSDLDALVIGSVVPRYVAWIADAFLFRIPFVSLVLRQLGAIPISPGRRLQLCAFRRSQEILRAGHAVGIFPEGHDTIVHGSGRKLGKFHGGFAELAVANQAPVLPVTLMPIEENMRPLNVPVFLKDWLKLPVDVADTCHRLVYSRVHVEIGPRIETSRYAQMRGDKTRLISDTRLMIGETFRRAVN